MKAAVIGGGPAGLMAAQVLAEAGAEVSLFEAKPTVGRKFLMAGKSGLNLTMDVPVDALRQGFDASAMSHFVRDFDAQAVKAWAEDLGQAVFRGSTGRVFPEVMKASPLLRAWIGRLDTLNVEIRTRWRWRGWVDGALQFDTPDGLKERTADVTVLALGGKSWARLGADGFWATILEREGIDIRAFQPSNSGLAVQWSPYMEKHFGAALKSVAWRAGDTISRGEAVVAARGLEGGGIYTMSPALRAGKTLTIDLLPDLSLKTVTERLGRARGRASLSNHLRKSLGLGPVKLALLHEWGGPLPRDPEDLGHLVKHLAVRHDGFRPIDEAISTVGGVPFTAMNDALMLEARAGVFCAGEMLDWDAPTGGYLITGCLASGRWAALGALEFLRLQSDAAADEN